MRREIHAGVPLFILASVLVLLFAPLLMGEDVLFWGLPSLQFYPWREFAFDELQSGRLPFWNPYSGGGAPLLANYQSAILYPPNWLYLLVTYTYAMNWLAVLHVFWSGLGMWLFMRQLGVRAFGRGISLLAFALGGYGIARMASFPTANAYAWMPWVFWGVLGIMDKRRLHQVGILSLITAMLLLTGHAQTAFYILFGAGLFTLWGAIWLLHDQPRSERLQVLGMATVGVLLGLGIAATQVFFTTELLRQSQRAGGVDFETLTNLSFHPLRLFNFIMPNFFGSPVDGSYLTEGRGSYFEDAVYVGILPLFAAIAAITGWFQRRHLLLLSEWKAFRGVPFWVFLTGLGFIFAMGKYTLLYPILYDNVPTFDAFREPVRWMVWVVFGISVLAGIGVHNWGRTPRLFYWTRLTGAAGGGMVVLALVVRYFDEGDSEFVPVLTGATLAFGAWLAGSALLTLAQPDESWNQPFTRWQWAVLIFLAADLTWAAAGLNPTVPREYYREVSLTEPQGRLYWFEDYETDITFDEYFNVADYRQATRNWPEVRRSLVPNINMLDDISTFNNFDPLKPRYHNLYVEMIESLGTDADQLLRAAGVGQVFGPIQPQGWASVQGDLIGYRAPQEPPTVWIVPQAEWASSNQATQNALTDTNWNPEESVILSGNAPLESDLPTPLTDVVFFEMVKETPDTRQYRVVTEGGGYLVLANTWYPGWQVELDGENVPLYRANMTFMAVQVPDGGGDITFRYAPTVSIITLGISFISFFITLAFIILGLARSTPGD